MRFAIIAKNKNRRFDCCPFFFVDLFATLRQMPFIGALRKIYGITKNMNFCRLNLSESAGTAFPQRNFSLFKRGFKVDKPLI
mgnify:CR=1 FL=1